MSMQGGFTNDWNEVRISKKPQSGGAAKSNAAVNAAMRSGNVSTVKKFGGGSNQSEASRNMAKLDAETEELSHVKVDSELKKNIQQARLAKKMTQAQLANAINEPPKTVNEYESGKAIPNGQIISKMERALGTKLRPPKKKK